MDFGIAGVTAITIICYVAAEAVKATKIDTKWLPVICGILGGLLGALGVYVMPDFPAEDVITAAAIGIVSGLASTGANQVYKQLKGGDNTGEGK